jgi:peptide/nickel transport system permease protein
MNIGAVDSPVVTGGPQAPMGDAEAITTKQRSQVQLIARRFFKHRLAVVSLVLLLVIIAFAFVGAELWRYDHTIHRGIASD